MHLGEYQSKSQHLICGVSQGSVLSPLAFNCYRCPLPDIIAKYGLESQIYADDTQILEDMARGDTSHVKLNQFLIEIHHWMHENILGINTSKTEVLLNGQATAGALLSQWPVLFGAVPIPPPKVKNLGVAFDAVLTCIPQVRSVIKNANYYLYF